MTIFDKCYAFSSNESELKLCGADGIYFLLTPCHDIISYCDYHKKSYHLLKSCYQYLVLTKQQAIKYRVML